MKRTALLRALATAVLACLLLAPASAATAVDGVPPALADAPGRTAGVLGPALVTVPVPEVVVRTTETSTSYLLPEAVGVRWLVDGRPVAEVATRDDGHWRLDGGPGTAPLVVVAVAEAGHRLLLPDGTTTARAAALDRRTAVDAVRPEVVDGDGTADVYVVPDVPGLVVADAAGTVLEPGSTHAVTGYVDHAAVVVLTLTAAPGHRLEVDGVPVEAMPGEGAPWRVELRFSGTTAVAPVAPTFTDGEPGTGTVEVPDVEGLEYRLDDVVAAPGAHAAAGAVTVTAHALDGYAVVGDATWSHVFPAAGAVPEEPVEPGPAVPVAGDARRGTGADGRTRSGAAEDPAAVAAAAPQDEPGGAALDPLTLLVGGLVLGGLLLLRGRRDQVV